MLQIHDNLPAVGVAPSGSREVEEVWFSCRCFVLQFFEVVCASENENFNDD